VPHPILLENDAYFGPDFKRMHAAAFTAAGENAKFHMLPPFGSDGHFLINSPDASVGTFGKQVSRRASLGETAPIFLLPRRDDQAPCSKVRRI
jgi:hypothetical protein